MIKKLRIRFCYYTTECHTEDYKEAVWKEIILTKKKIDFPINRSFHLNDPILIHKIWRSVFAVVPVFKKHVTSTLNVTCIQLLLVVNNSVRAEWCEKCLLCGKLVITTCTKTLLKVKKQKYTISLTKRCEVTEANSM